MVNQFTKTIHQNYHHYYHLFDTWYNLLDAHLYPEFVIISSLNPLSWSLKTMSPYVFTVLIPNRILSWKVHVSFLVLAKKTVHKKTVSWNDSLPNLNDILKVMLSTRKVRLEVAKKNYFRRRTRGTIKLVIVSLNIRARVFLHHCVMLQNMLWTEVHSEPSQACKTELFAKIVNSWKALTIFVKGSILDV